MSRLCSLASYGHLPNRHLLATLFIRGWTNAEATDTVPPLTTRIRKLPILSSFLADTATINRSLVNVVGFC